MQAIWRADQSLSAHGATMKAAPHYAFIAGMYMRCCGLQRGVAEHLLPADMATEAMILGRPLFEDSVRLQEMSLATTTDRAGMALQWAHNAYVDEINLATQIIQLGDADWSDIKADRHRRSREVLDYAANQGIRLKGIGHPEKRAVRLGRKADLWAYRLSHRFVHGSVVALSSRIRRFEDIDVWQFSDVDFNEAALGTLGVAAVWTSRCPHLSRSNRRRRCSGSRKASRSERCSTDANE
jgi:hypothetical protein